MPSRWRPVSCRRTLGPSPTPEPVPLAPTRTLLLALSLAALPIPAAGAQGLPTGSPSRLGFSPGRLARLDTLLQSAVAANRTAGVVALVVRDGQVAWSGSVGMADREAGRPMTPDALFRIASESKAVTSVAIMILVEEGRLRLNQRVADFLPGFATARVAVATDTGRALVPARRAITIRDLLTQTAGLSYGTDSLIRDDYRAAGLGPAAGYGWYLADKDEGICTTMDRLSTLPLAAQPGEAWVYGYAADVLGCVVERASGVPFDQFLQQRIFAPLRMRDTWFFPPPEMRNRLTVVYTATAAGGLQRADTGARGQGEYLGGPRRDFSGGAGLVSTAGDFARFLQMLLNGGELDGARILAPATVALMTAPAVDSLYGTAGMAFSFGFEVLVNPGRAGQYGAPGRFSWGGAYATSYTVDPASRMVLVFMQQLLPGGDRGLAQTFRTMAYSALLTPTEGPR